MLIKNLMLATGYVVAGSLLVSLAILPVVFSDPLPPPAPPQTFKLNLLPKEEPSTTTSSSVPELLLVQPPPTTITIPTTTTTVTTESSVTTVVLESASLTPLEKAVTQIGRQEGQDPYSAGGFWCARFLSYILDRPAEEWDSPDGISPGHLAFHYPTTDNPQPGDLVTIDLMGKGQQPTHIGMVEEINGTTIHTIEGNTGNPPAVNRHTRQIGDGYILEFHEL